MDTTTKVAIGVAVSGGVGYALWRMWPADPAAVAPPEYGDGAPGKTAPTTVKTPSVPPTYMADMSAWQPVVE